MKEKKTLYLLETRQEPKLIYLSTLAGLLALIAAGAGLFWQDGGSAFPFTTLRGEQIQIYGRGIYHNDALSSAATYIGTDAVTVLLMVPLMFYALWRYQRGSLRGGVLLISALGCILYNSLHMVFAVTYNNLFLLYVAFFSACLFAFILAFTSIHLSDLPVHVSAQMPRRGPAVFLFIAGGCLALVWLSDLLPAMLEGKPPMALGSSTTLVTYAIDLSVVVPTTLLAGILLLRRAPLGYLLSILFLVVNAIVGIVVIAQSVTQIIIGGPLSAGIVAVFVLPFILLAGFAGWYTVRMLWQIRD